MAYATVAELKEHLAGDAIQDSDDDTLLTLALDAVSENIDDYCNRTFTAAASATRFYTVTKGIGVVFVDDIGDDATAPVITLDTDDDGTYATALTDFTLEPVNAEVDGEPWTQIWSDEWDAVGVRNGVKVVALFGWPSVPNRVKQATLIQSARIFTRKNSPYGIAGSPDTGSELRLLDKLDPDVEQLLTRLRRFVIE